ncbi:MAG TPA: Lrp/AsnC ligand binding domain-containing protein [Mycobacteriales bacterium]|jgi:DNA-binding Lrp family transcriptional regulator|nr:Lrp/AsnC ligand binding domain-containing protein [Mycobacteriales bacterium]
MVEAYILIQVTNGTSHRVASQLAELAEVITAHPIMGPYDVITFVRVEDADAMGHLITDHMHTIAGVSRTLTCTVVPSTADR